MIQTKHTGFAVLGSTVGISRIVVSKTNHWIENCICITPHLSPH